MQWPKFKYIESILRDYPNYDEYIKDRERKLFHPDTLYEDENIGGGRSNFVSNPTATMAVTIAEDRRLCSLGRYKTAIDEALEETDKITKSIIEQYYFARPQLKTWAGVANEMHMSERQCRRLRDTFFESIENKLGLP